MTPWTRIQEANPINYISLLTILLQKMAGTNSNFLDSFSELLADDQSHNGDSPTNFPPRSNLEDRKIFKKISKKNLLLRHPSTAPNCNVLTTTDELMEVFKIMYEDDCNICIYLYSNIIIILSK